MTPEREKELQSMLELGLDDRNQEWASWDNWDFELSDEQFTEEELAYMEKKYFLDTKLRRKQDARRS